MRRPNRAAARTIDVDRVRSRVTERMPLSETLVAMGIWFALVFSFDALVLGLGTAANVGISFFAGFMLATLTVTGRHMMFRLTQEDDQR